jgi:short-subunit dehydrogenase
MGESSTRTIAIFGAGPGLGRSVARRFGREGFQVALVARDPGRLDDMTGELKREGVTAAPFPADLTDTASALAAADAIEARFGPIDVLHYSPALGRDALRPASEIDVATVTSLLDMAMLTPVALVGRVLPGMLARGNGALLFAFGAAAKHPVPRFASGGLTLAGLRNYVHTLHAELAPGNVYAGDIVIGALIEGSAAHRNAADWSGGHPMAVVSPDDLADRLWDMYLTRDRPEDEITPAPSATPAPSKS